MFIIRNRTTCKDETIPDFKRGRGDQDPLFIKGAAYAEKVNGAERGDSNPHTLSGPRILSPYQRHL